MAESTLTLTLLDIKSALGEYLGISRDKDDWTSENTADVSRIMAVGQRQFYAPSYRPVPNAPLKPYVWSFLRGRLSQAISSSTASYDMPNDFTGFLEPRLSFTSTKTWSLKLTSMDDFLEHVQDFGTSMPSGISQPLLAALESKTSTLGATGQRWTLYLWPTPTASATITAQYRIAPNVLADDTYYPLGGELHSETLLESCLAAAEEHLNDQLTIHRQRFDELLNQSILLDQSLHAQEAA
jgi:hypothetical protein